MSDNLLICLFVFLASGCAKSQLDVTDAYVRAPVAQRDVSAAFMTIENTGSTAVALLGGSTPMARRVELHQHTHDQGTMRMRQVDLIRIPPNTTIKLEPGGYHMMLIGVAPQLRNLKEIQLTLEFSTTESLQLTAPVRSVLEES